MHPGMFSREYQSTEFQFELFFSKIYYDEFIKIQVPNDRANFVQRKVKEAIGLK